MTKLRVGLVGCGSMGGGVHAPGLASHSQVELTAIADVTPPNLERVGDEQGIPVQRRFADAEDLAALPDLDLVVVATPPWLRKEPVLAALNAGKHVLAEKPLASVPQDAWEMAEAAKRADRVLAMMHNYLFFPEFVATKAAIDRGAIGKVQTVSANLLCVPDNPGAATFQPGWRRDLGRAGGGILMDMLHPLYVMSWLASAPVSEVSAMIRRTGEGPLPVDDLAMCHLRMDDVYASLNLGWGLGPGGIGVGGTEGRLWLRYVNNGTTPFDRFHSAFMSDGFTTRPLEVEGLCGRPRFGACKRGRAFGMGVCRVQHAGLVPQPGERCGGGCERGTSAAKHGRGRGAGRGHSPGVLCLGGASLPGGPAAGHERPRLP